MALVPQEKSTITTESYGSINGDQNKKESAATNSRPTVRSEHLGKHRQYWRDIILGVNDGLISTFLLVAGVAGSGLSSNDILLTAIAGALAGGMSMCFGEYIATKSQREVMEGEIGLERQHIRNYKQEEIKEVTELLEIIGIPSDKHQLREQIQQFYEGDSEALLKLMIALEFGVVEEEERSPIAAALTSGLLFLLGSLPSLLPFVPPEQTITTGLVLASVATVMSLLLVGAIKTWATRGECWNAAIENLVIAGLGGLLAFWVGSFFDGVVHR